MMRRWWTVAFFFVFRAAWAQVPPMMNYQGYLTDTGGAPLSGDYDLAFSIHDSVTGGAELWSEAHAAVPVSDGLFSVLLGETNPLDTTVFANEAWLELEVDGETMDPRVRVVSVGYSFVAAVAHSVAPDAVDSAAIRDGEIVNADVSATAAIDVSKLSGVLPLAGGTLTGTLALAGDPAQDAEAATRRYVDQSITTAGNDYVKKVGDTMTGPLTVQDVIESTSGGFRFPDGTTQATAGVSSVDTGEGLSGGPITDSGTVDLRLNGGGGLSKTLGAGADELGIAPAGVADSHLADACVKAAHLQQMGAALDQVLKWDGAGWAPADDVEGTGPWTVSGDDVYRLVGKVGIGDSTPEAALDVEGSLVTTGAVRLGAASTDAPLPYHAFGTGTTDRGLGTPGDVLVSAGLEVDGTLFADGGVTIPATVRYLNVPHAAFKAMGSWTTYDSGGIAGLYSTTAGVGRFYAPVELPDGAVIEELAVKCLDNEPAGGLNVRLDRRSFSTLDTGSLMVGTGLTSDQAGWQIVTDSTVDDATIDNQNYYYHLQLGLEAASTDLALGGVRIKYTVTEPLP